MIPNIPLPRLLDSSGGTAGFIRPIRESITLTKTPLSYATMELPVGERLPARGLVELFTSAGSVGVFRVSSPQDAYGEDITTAELEHAIVEVGDYIIRGSIKGTLSASAAMRQVFQHYRGTLWQLGDVTALGDGNIQVDLGRERILDAMLSILSERPECFLAFDFSTTPWTVFVKSKDTTVTAEGRLSRNINAARISYDDTELCTRVYYPVPVTNAETGEVTADWRSIDADTIATYGIAERTCFNSSDQTAADAQATAEKYLEKHKTPRFSIQITGEEFSTITGEPLDSFDIGKLFRLALPDYDVTVSENISTLSWGDVYGAPTAVDITLDDEEINTVSVIHEIDKSGGTTSGGNSSGVEEKVRTVYYNRTVSEEVDLVKIKANAAGEILAQAGLSIDPETGVLIYADDFEQNIGAKFNVQANKIGMVVGTYQGQNYIKAGEIAIAINQSTGESEAKIDADHIYIGNEKSTTVIAGKATIADLNAAKARITSLEADAITTNTLSAEISNLSAVTITRANITSVYASGLVSTPKLIVGTKTASWQETQVVTDVYRTLSAQKAFAMENGTTWYSAVVTQVTRDVSTIHYLGQAAT